MWRIDDKEFVESIIFKFVELMTRLLLFMRNKIKREPLAFVGRLKTRHVLHILQMIARFAVFFFFFFFILADNFQLIRERSRWFLTALFVIIGNKNLLNEWLTSNDTSLEYESRVKRLRFSRVKCAEFEFTFLEVRRYFARFFRTRTERVSFLSKVSAKIGTYAYFRFILYVSGKLNN